MNVQRINEDLRQLARDAHESSIDAHGFPVDAIEAWEFITQTKERDEYIGKPMPRVFAAHYAAWGRDFQRAQALGSQEVR